MPLRLQAQDEKAATVQISAMAFAHWDRRIEIVDHEGIADSAGVAT